MPKRQRRKQVDYDVITHFDTILTASPAPPRLSTYQIRFRQRICQLLKKSGLYPFNLNNAEQITRFGRSTPEYDESLEPAAKALGNKLPGDGTNGIISMDVISPTTIEVTYDPQATSFGQMMDQIGKIVWEVNQTGWPPSDPYASV